MATLATGPSGANVASSWTFRALLDGRPIGEHRYSLTPSVDGAGHTVISEAAFAVSWFGLTVYKYKHRAVEHWRDDCLVGLEADTDDNGQPTRVAAALKGDVFEVSTPTPLKVRGCVMSFAYWNTAMRSQQRLLNSQTGRLEAVRIAPVEEGAVEHGARPASASGWRIGGLARPIVLWYSPQGQWLGLDTRVDGGRLLSYRLQ